MESSIYLLCKINRKAVLPLSHNFFYHPSRSWIALIRDIQKEENRYSRAKLRSNEHHAAVEYVSHGQDHFSE